MSNKWEQKGCTSKVELSISCRNLVNADTFSKSDPQCVVHIKDSYKGDYRELGRTEVIDDNLNPDFVKKIQVDYNFEMVQSLKFEVWDIDVGGMDFLGRIETTLPEIIASKGAQFERPLVGIAHGTIVIVVEEVSSCNDIIHLQFRGKSIKKLGWFWKPSPFLSFWRSNEGGTFTVVHKTDHRSYSQSPTWAPMTLSVKDLCNGDYNRNLRIDCMSNHYDGDHKLLGSFFTTVHELSSEQIPHTFQLTSKARQGPRGFIELLQAKLEKRYSFFEYIRGGTEMHFVVAVDFTASNGDVRDPSSLHYIDPTYGQPNAYEIALRSVGEIVQYYSDKEYFAGFGFGAKLDPNGNVSHEFPLNGNPGHPYCRGVDDLILNYRNTLSRVTLYGPTNFAPVINSTANIARQNDTGKSFFVLLIITDGIICDMYQTKRAIVAASRLPLSIIIVGVGNADFSAMDELDSDDQLLTVDNLKAARDIVQFVPLNKFLDGRRSYVASKADLAREVLYEVPEQLVSYMSLKGFHPRPTQ